MGTNVLTNFWLALGWIGYAYAVDHHIKPTRAECKSGPRPCGWVSCRQHIALDQSVVKTIKYRGRKKAFEGLTIIPVALTVNKKKGRKGSYSNLTEDSEIDYTGLLDHLEIHGSCALDIAEQESPLTLADVGRKLCVTRERARQHEVSALAKINANPLSDILQEFTIKDDK